MASIPIEISRSPLKGAGASFIDRVLSGAGKVVKGAGDVITGVLSSPTTQRWGDAVLDHWAQREARKHERDMARERPEAAQGAAGGAGGDPAMASASVTGGAAPIGAGLGNLGVPIALGLGAVLLVVTVLALRR